MSIAGYFCKRVTELRMPKSGDSASNQARDALSIRFEGPVLTGEKSVAERHREVAIRASSPLGESYKTVEDYDPVLRSHCRLDSDATS